MPPNPSSDTDAKRITNRHEGLVNLLCAKDEDPRHRTKEPAGVRLCLSPVVAAASSTCGVFSLMHRSHDRRLDLHCAMDEVPEQTEEPELAKVGKVEQIARIITK